MQHNSCTVSNSKLIDRFGKACSGRVASTHSWEHSSKNLSEDCDSKKGGQKISL